MRKILTLILSTVFISSYAQTKLLNKYQFEKGGYAIVGLLSESDPNSLQKKLGVFYTDDIEVLNEFKKTWTFSKKSPMYACGYHYSIHLTYNGTILESYDVNLNCNVIASDRGYFYFDTIKLSYFNDKLKKPFKKKHYFDSIPEGKKFITAIKKDKKLLLTFEPDWTKFDGKFTFTYKNPDKNDNDKIVEKRIKANLKKLYPKYEFILRQVMWSTGGEYEFEIKCLKKLFDEFNIYNKKENWEEYKPTLTTYWK